MPIISNSVIMSIAKSTKILARQRQLLLAKVTEPLAIQNVIDEARVSLPQLKKCGVQFNTYGKYIMNILFDI